MRSRWSYCNVSWKRHQASIQPFLTVTYFLIVFSSSLGHISHPYCESFHWKRLFYWHLLCLSVHAVGWITVNMNFYIILATDFPNRSHAHRPSSVLRAWQPTWHLLSTVILQVLFLLLDLKCPTLILAFYSSFLVNLPIFMFSSTFQRKWNGKLKLSSVVCLK